MDTHNKWIFLLFCSLCLHISAQEIQNPILPGVADAGVVKYNGKYYIGGVHTNGDFYISDDLVHWGKPVHVVSIDNDWIRDSKVGNDQIHANHMLYDNGTFHLYWSVNYWGKDKHAVHIVHAQSDSILGPYIEPVKATWMDNRIDPYIFKDDDGRLYMYMVRFTDGNTIWGRKMKNPSEFSGEPVFLFSSLPDTWETMDNRVAEGPCVIKYRGKYYMMYNANHTSTEWGNYQLGVSVADSPLGFQNGSKYSYPVVKSNQIDLEDNNLDVLRYYDNGYFPQFAYCEFFPGNNWTKKSFDDSGWKRGMSGFSGIKLEGSTTRSQGTAWTSDRLWLRKTFHIKKVSENYILRVAHDGATKIYLNGRLVYDKQGADYCMIDFNREQLQYLVAGENILAVETNRGVSTNFFDVALFNADKEQAFNILYSPGQPNIVRGVNGFEWWLVYMANKNAEMRGQYVNRIHFFDKELYVDGITDCSSEGYHPEPSLPTWKDNFDNEVESVLKWNWINQDDWSIENGELKGKSISSLSCAFVNNVIASQTYLFETGINPDGNSGIIVWWKDNQNHIRLGLDKIRHTWYLLTCLQGKNSRKDFKLPSDFKWKSYHSMRVERNMNQLLVWIDEIPAVGQSCFTDLPYDSSIPGIFIESGTAAFDGALYTIGFDEYDSSISEWNVLQGNCTRGSEGLKTIDEKFIAVKGENLSRYTFEAQVTNTSLTGSAGIYPIYVDDKNYVKLVLNSVTHNWEVEIVKNGKVMLEKKHGLSSIKTVYPDVKYTDFIEKCYPMSVPVWIDGVYLNRHEINNKSEFVENMFSKFNIEYLWKGEWKSLPIKDITIPEHIMYNKATMAPMQIEALRFINKNPEDYNRHIYKIRVDELFKASYNLRVVRNSERLFLFIDGVQIAEFPIDFGDSCIGLYAENTSALYNGMLYYHIGK